MTYDNRKRSGFALPGQKTNIWMDGRPWLAPTIRQMSNEEAAYLGGLFDGDGSVYPRRKQWVICIANNDPELISAPLRFTQTGSVQSAIARGKLHMLWHLYRQADVLEFLIQIRPFSAKAQEVLS